MAKREEMRNEESAESLRRYTTPIMLLGLIVLFICYFPSFSGPRMFDDEVVVTVVPDTHGIIDILIDQPWMNPAARPLVRLTFQLESRLFGESQFVHRVGNVLIHFLTGLSLYFLAMLLMSQLPQSSTSVTKCWSVAIVGMLLWLFHPLNSAAIAYVAQRCESLMGLFFVLFLYCSARWRISGSVAWLGLAGLSMAAGIYSKTIIITAPAVMLLMDRAFLADSWRAVVRAQWKLAAAGVLLTIPAVWTLLPGLMTGAGNVGFGGDAPPVPLYLAAQCQVIWLYIFSACWPQWLSIDHGLQVPATVWQNGFWIGLTSALLAGVLWILWGRKWAILFLVLSPLIILSPTSSFIPTADLWVDHRMYLPLAFLTFGFASILFLRCSTTVEAARSWLVAGIAGLLLASCCYLRATDYSTGMKLWAAAVVENPDNDRAIQNLIHASSIENRESEVLPFLRQLDRELRERRQESWILLVRLGEQEIYHGEAATARTTLMRAFQLQKRQLPVHRDLRRAKNLAALYVCLALSDLSRNELVTATQYLELAFHTQDSSAEARALAGSLARDRGDLTSAILHFRRALELRPGWPDVQRDLQAIEKGVTP